MRIAHLISPVKVGEDRDLYFQQPITFETLRAAKEFARDEVHVEHIAVCYKEDMGIVPEWFDETIELIDEIGNYQTFEVKRKLPLFIEMLDKLYETSDVNYFIQTNADIGLQPYFYLLIKKLIEDGNDSFCINKRIIPEDLKLNNIEDIPVIWSTLGSNHAGHDCFVFRRELYPKFDIGRICMGTPWSEATLIANLVAYAKNFTVFRYAHATFHLGDRRIWRPKEYNDYRFHNCNEFAKVLKKLSIKKKKILKHETIRYLLHKVKVEYLAYDKSEQYNEDFRYFATR